MGLTDASAAIYASLITAVIGAAVTVFIWWRQNRSPRRQRRVKDAWQKQAEALDERLRKQYEGEIAYLKEQLASERNTGRGNAHD